MRRRTQTGVVSLGAVIITAVLTCIVGFCAYWLFQERDGVRIARLYNAQQDVSTLSVALANYRTKHGVVPSTLDELVPDQLARVPEDPWGRPYRYDSTNPVGRNIVSLGADGALGGRGECADIGPETQVRALIEQMRLKLCGA